MIVLDAMRRAGTTDKNRCARRHRGNARAMSAPAA
jgi:hypothetical protein